MAATDLKDDVIPALPVVSCSPSPSNRIKKKLRHSFKLTSKVCLDRCLVCFRLVRNAKGDRLTGYRELNSTMATTITACIKNMNQIHSDTEDTESSSGCSEYSSTNCSSSSRSQRDVNSNISSMSSNLVKGEGINEINSNLRIEQTEMASSHLLYEEEKHKQIPSNKPQNKQVNKPQQTKPWTQHTLNSRLLQSINLPLLAKTTQSLSKICDICHRQATTLQFHFKEAQKLQQLLNLKLNKTHKLLVTGTGKNRLQRTNRQVSSHKRKILDDSRTSSLSLLTKIARTELSMSRPELNLMQKVIKPGLAGNYKIPDFSQTEYLVRQKSSAASDLKIVKAKNIPKLDKNQSTYHNHVNINNFKSISSQNKHHDINNNLSSIGNMNANCELGSNPGSSFKQQKLPLSSSLTSLNNNKTVNFHKNANQTDLNNRMIKHQQNVEGTRSGFVKTGSHHSGQSRSTTDIMSDNVSESSYMSNSHYSSGEQIKQPDLNQLGQEIGSRRKRKSVNPSRLMKDLQTETTTISTTNHNNNPTVLDHSHTGQAIQKKTNHNQFNGHVNGIERRHHSADSFQKYTNMPIKQHHSTTNRHSNNNNNNNNINKKNQLVNRQIRPVNQKVDDTNENTGLVRNSSNSNNKNNETNKSDLLIKENDKEDTLVGVNIKLGLANGNGIVSEETDGECEDCEDENEEEEHEDGDRYLIGGHGCDDEDDEDEEHTDGQKNLDHDLETEESGNDIDIDQVEADAQEDDIDEHVHNNSHQSHNHNHLNPDSSDAEDDCASIENDENLHHQLTSALKQATMLKRRKLEQGNMTKKVFNIKNNLHRNINNSSGIGNVSDMQHSQMEGRYGGGQAYKEAVSVGNGKSNGQKRFKIKNENLANRSLNNSGGESKIMNNNNLAIYDENSNNSKSNANFISPSLSASPSPSHMLDTSPINVRSHFAYLTSSHSSNGSTKHACEVCKKTFKTQNILRQHMRIHTGDKPFVCEICSKAFSQMASLKYHLATHSDARPYRCEICSKTFKLKPPFKKHIKECQPKLLNYEHSGVYYNPNGFNSNGLELEANEDDE